MLVKIIKQSGMPSIIASFRTNTSKSYNVDSPKSEYEAFAHGLGVNIMHKLEKHLGGPLFFWNSDPCSIFLLRE